jgi:hypothetical protein
LRHLFYVHIVWSRIKYDTAAPGLLEWWDFSLTHSCSQWIDQFILIVWRKEGQTARFSRNCAQMLSYNRIKYSVRLRTGRSWFDPRQRQRIFLPVSASRPALGLTQPPVQWVPGALSPGVKHGRGVMLTTHPLLVPRLRNSRSYTSCHPNAPLWSVTGPLYLFLLQEWQKISWFGITDQWLTVTSKRHILFSKTALWQWHVQKFLSTCYLLQ